MLRMAPLASIVLLSLFVGCVQAEEETFDTHCMIGGMQADSRLPVNMNLTFMLISNGAENIR